MKPEAKIPLVSALVSTYNAESYIAGCLDSLEAQSIADSLEIIVVNSGSRQNEDRIVRKYQKKYDNIQYIETEKRETIYAAWNRAIRISRGKYITNANTDDRLKKNALETLAGALDQNPDMALAYANQTIIKPYKDGRHPSGEGIYGYYLRQRLLSRELDVGSQPLWRRSLHDEFGYFDETFFVAGDTEFWLRISQKYNFMYVNKVLGERTFRPDGVWLSEKDGLCGIEKTLLLTCYNYVQELHISIDERGISSNPLFAGWPEVNLWKKRVHDKLSGRNAGLNDHIRSISDLRSNNTPMLTIIVSAGNRPDDLHETLQALHKQGRQDFEAIVVNNGDELYDPAAIARELNQGLCCIEMKHNVGAALSRNIAAGYARADHIAFLDDGDIPRNDFVVNILNHFKDARLCGLRGRILNTGEGSSMPQEDPGEDIMPAACDISGNFAFRKDVFLESGGFNINLFSYEGAELSFRLFISKNQDIHCLLYFPDVVVYQQCCNDSNNMVLGNIRRMTAEKLYVRSNPELASYLQFMDGYYSRKRYDVKYRKYLEWSRHCENSDPEAAMKYLERAIALNPHEYPACFHLGLFYERRDEIRRALSMFEKTISLLEDIVSHESAELLALRNYTELNDCYVNCALKLAKMNGLLERYDKAAATLEKLLSSVSFHVSPAKESEIRQWLLKFRSMCRKSEPCLIQDAQRLNQEGEELFMEGDIRGALTAFSEAVAAAPGYATPYNNLGVLFWNQGDTERAFEYFSKAIHIAPDNREAIINHGRVLAGLNRIEEARDIFCAYLDRHPDDVEISGLLHMTAEDTSLKQN